MTSNMSENIDLNNYINEPWDIISLYFKGKHLQQLVRHQIESYNDFTKNQIPKTINMFNPINIVSPHDYVKEHNTHKLKISITFTNFNLHRPHIYENNGAVKLMFPQEAREIGRAHV